jgi:hypothetical protein
MHYSVEIKHIDVDGEEGEWRVKGQDRQMRPKRPCAYVTSATRDGALRLR